MVAAWIRAETGVGPSIASGSHVCRKNCADLPIAPINSSTQARSSADQFIPMNHQVLPTNSGMRGNISANWMEPTIQ